MTVSPDCKHPRFQISVFRQDHMANPLLIMESGHSLLFHPVMCQIQDCSGFSIKNRDIVIGDHHQFFWIPDLHPEPLKDWRHPARTSGIMDHGKIHRADFNFTNLDFCFSCSSGNDFLGQGLGQGVLYILWSDHAEFFHSPRLSDKSIS